MNKMMVRVVLGFFILLGMLGVVFFVGSGTLNWPKAWVIIGLLLASTVFSRLTLLKINPELAQERASAGKAQNVKPWDRFLMPWVAIWGPFITYLVCALDYRYQLSQPPPPLWAAAGLLATLAGMLISSWAMFSNPFFSAYARIQTDRGQIPIQQGPYRWIRHPGYAGGILAAIGIPVFLGTLWGVAPGLTVALALAIRTHLEDKTLQAELPGYAVYASQVPYRLIPGIY